MSLEEQIRQLEEEIKNTPYNKATEHHIGRLKAKLARLREEAEKQKAKTGRPSFSIKKDGDATVVLVGFPSVGKSSLLNALTGAKSEIGAYDFTTLKPVPGMLEYNGAKIQIIDLPGIVEGASKGRGKGREIISAVRNSDLVVIIADPFNLESIKIIQRELYNGGIRLNQKPPEVYVKKLERGGLKITSTVPLSIDEQTIYEVLREYRIHNAEVLIREDVTVDRFIDAILRNRVYIPAIVVVNKIDLYNPGNLPDSVIPVSAEKKINLDLLAKSIYEKLDLIRIFLKPPGGKADLNEPMIIKRGMTVGDVCKKLHKDMYRNFRYARVIGKSAKFKEQRVGIDHVLEDGDILTIYA
ncbi:small GTP-binding protein domain protein [Archaeoglobus sulfaticallidus PM70-1]|uniref:Small GTP-binding protein domain protein n=1 Tax=Archaeoglobus sulfaticallidus PM70-1 TaxID=387631 RepID=N0BCG4_9EURY|nr:GTP-binding protein [Archaeoglobus sulfaticallidus]AGK60688.1 small GTP-binding protein domain protein [Archaeoglobus sulfaticallidus PM70-1]